MGFKGKKISDQKNQFYKIFDDFCNFFAYLRETWKFWNPKNHEFSKNRPKIEFRCTYQFKSSSFWKYMLVWPFWCISHSQKSFFQTVTIDWSHLSDSSKSMKSMWDFPILVCVQKIRERNGVRYIRICFYHFVANLMEFMK